MVTDTAINGVILQTLSIEPSARYQAGMARIGSTQYALLFGGRRLLSSQFARDDHWLFDFVSRSWIPMPNTGPVRVHSHAMVSIGDGVLAYGGRHMGTYRKETYRFDEIILSWSLVASAGGPGSVGASMAYDSVNDRVCYITQGYTHGSGLWRIWTRWQFYFRIQHGSFYF